VSTGSLQAGAELATHYPAHRYNTARETLTRRRAALEGMEGQLLAVPPGGWVGVGGR
jgi:hypothetical protein